MICTICRDFDGDHNTCARCRDILKYEMAKFIREGTRIYLSEQNRFKGGKRSKFTLDDQYNIRELYLEGNSLGEIAKKKRLRSPPFIMLLSEQT